MHECGNFSAWLFRIAYNCFLQQHRSANRRTEVTEDFAQQYEVLTEKYDSISTAQIDLEQAMSQLNENEVAVITLCYSFGYSHSEVADILNIPLGTVKSNINRGKHKLRQLLTDATLEKAS
ncbi:MAG: RNA polymerase sigma factor [Proteobacteria bacterium]|nr:RNA polymerase sigma factor [Pseudomonadota bacterium]